MAKAWIEDAWFAVDKETGDKVRKARHGTGKRWIVRWRALDTDGLEQPKSRSFRTKPEAEEWRDSVAHEVRAGIYRDPKLAETPFRDVAEEWLKSSRASASSVGKYEHRLRSYVLPAFGNRPVGQIKKPQIDTWVTALQSGTAKARYKVYGSEPARYHDVQTMRRPLAANTIDAAVTVLKAALSWAVEADHIGKNPASKVATPRVPKSDRTYLTPEQVEDLADAAQAIGSATDRALVLTLAYTGIRIGEAMALRVRSVDLDGRRASIVQTWSRDKKGTRHLTEPKDHERRAVPLTNLLVTELRALMHGKSGEDFVFRNSLGGAMDDHNWRDRTWKKAAAETGLTGLKPHDLRHAAASMAVKQNANVKVVQRMLGHASAAMTLDTYTDLFPDDLDDVADAMEMARITALEARGTAKIRTIR